MKSLLPALCSLVLAVPAFGQAAPSSARAPAELMPAQSLFFLQFDGIDAHRDAYNKTVLARLMKGELGAFLRDVARRIEKAVSRDDPRAPLPDEEADATTAKLRRKYQQDSTRWPQSVKKLLDQFWIQGVAISIDYVSNDDFQITCIFQNGANHQHWMHLHRLFRMNVLDTESLPQKPAKMHGRDVFQLRLPSEVDKAKTAPRAVINGACWKEGNDVVFIYGTRPLSETLDVIDGKRLNLTSHPLYKKVAHCPAYESAARGFVDVKQIVELVIHNADSNDKLARGIETVGRRLMINHLGLGGVHGLTWNYGFEGKHQRTTVRLGVAEPEQRQGLLKLLSAPASFAARDLPPLPDDADFVGVYHVDWQQVFDTLMQTRQSVQMAQWLAAGGPLAGKMPAEEAALKDALGMDVRNELLAALDANVVLSCAYSEGPWLLGTTLAVKVKDAAKARAALDKVFLRVFKSLGLPQELAVEQTTYAGATIRTVRIARNGMCLFPSYTIHDGWLVIGAFPQNVKSHLWRLRHRTASWKAPAIATQAIQAGMQQGNARTRLAAVTVIDPRRSLNLVLPWAPLGSLMSASPYLYAASRPAFDVGAIPHTKAVTSKLSPNVTVLFDDGDAWRWESHATLEIPSGVELGILCLVPNLLELPFGELRLPPAPSGR